MQLRFLGLVDPLGEETQPTPVVLPGKSHGQRNLAGYSPRSHKGSNTTKDTHSALKADNFFSKDVRVSGDEIVHVGSRKVMPLKIKDQGRTH